MKNPFSDTGVCVSRLFSEWIKHKRLIIGLDYDSTIRPHPYVESIEYSEVIALVKQASDMGFYIVLFTASVPERFDSMLKFCESKGIRISSINKNPINLPFGNNGKIYYNILLCDRAGLGQSCEILQKTIDRIKDSL